MLDKLTHRAAATATNRHGTTATATRICRLPCWGHCFVPMVEGSPAVGTWQRVFHLEYNVRARQHQTLQYCRTVYL